MKNLQLLALAAVTCLFTGSASQAGELPFMKRASHDTKSKQSVEMKSSGEVKKGEEKTTDLFIGMPIANYGYGYGYGYGAGCATCPTQYAPVQAYPQANCATGFCGTGVQPYPMQTYPMQNYPVRNYPVRRRQNQYFQQPVAPVYQQPYAGYGVPQRPFGNPGYGQQYYQPINYEQPAAGVAPQPALQQPVNYNQPGLAPVPQRQRQSNYGPANYGPAFPQQGATPYYQ